MLYQCYRERNSPPFLPPNLQYWKALRRAVTFLYQKSSQCCRRFTKYSDASQNHRSNTGDSSSCVESNYQSANSRSSNLYVTTAGEEDHRNDNSVPSDLDENGHLRSRIGYDSALGGGGISVADRMRSNVDSIKTWIATGGGFRKRSNFAANYQSFPRYPDDDGDEININEGDTNGGDDGDRPTSSPTPADALTSVTVHDTTTNSSITSRMSQSLTSLRNKVTNATGRSWRPSMFGRRPLVADDVDSDGSSDDAEVDRRAAGIFGADDRLSASREESDKLQDLQEEAEEDEEGQFVDAAEGDLSDRPEHSFGSSQLAFQ